MVRICVVPGCSNTSNRECHLSYHSLPLKNKKLCTTIATTKLSQFILHNILENDQKIQYYTGFRNYGTLKSFYDFLGPAVNYFNCSAGVAEKSPTGRNRVLPPMEEFF